MLHHTSDGLPAGAELGSRKRKYLSGINDSGNGSLSGYCGLQALRCHAPLILAHSQNRGSLRVNGNGSREQAEQSTVG